MIKLRYTLYVEALYICTCTVFQRVTLYALGVVDFEEFKFPPTKKVYKYYFSPTKKV